MCLAKMIIMGLCESENGLGLGEGELYQALVEIVYE